MREVEEISSSHEQNGEGGTSSLKTKQTLMHHLAML